MNDAIKTFAKTFVGLVTVGVFLVSSMVAGSRFIPFGPSPNPTPPTPLANIAEKTATGFREYGRDLGLVAGKHAERLRALSKAKREQPATYKPITVQELLDGVHEDSEKARDVYRGKLNSFMTPALGSGDVDPDAALPVFEGMEAGFKK